MHLQQLLIITTLSMLVGAVSSCGGNANKDLPPATGAAPQAEDLHTLPPPSEFAQHESSFVAGDGLRQGSEFDTGLPHDQVIASGPLGVLLPDYGDVQPESLEGLAYATYSFGLPAYDGSALSIYFDWTETPQQDTLYIAVADFTMNRWRWFAGESHDELPLETLTPYINEEDTLLLVVATTGMLPSVLASILIQEPGMPQAVLDADVDTGPAPLEVFFDASASLDPDGSIANYEWDMDGDGLFSEVGAEQAGVGQAVPPHYFYDAGVHHAAVRVTDDSGNTDIAERLIVATGGGAPMAELTAVPLEGWQPLTVEFDASASTPNYGSIVLYEWDFDGDHIYNESDNGEDLYLNESQLTYTFIDNGFYDSRVRVTNSVGGQDSAHVLVSIDNAAPIARLSADVLEGDAPLSVNFDATASSDSDGLIVQYDWDFDGDTLFNEQGAEAAAQGNPKPNAVLYPDPGYYDVSVRVWDDDNYTDEASVVVHVLGWVIITLDTAPPPHANINDSDLALIDGRPSVVWRYRSSQTQIDEIRHARSQSARGSKAADWLIGPLGDWQASDFALADLGGQVGLALTMGAPTEGLGQLCYRVADGEGIYPEDWSEAVLVDETESMGFETQLLVVDGRPAIFYEYTDVADVMYAHATTADGADAADWSVRRFIDGEGFFAKELHAGIVSGHPAVVYVLQSMDGGGSQITYCRSLSPTGDGANDWSVKQQVGTMYLTAAYPSLAIVAGTPAAVYSDSTPTNLYYALSDDANGAGWPTALNLDPSFSYVSGAHLLLIDNAPAYVALRQSSLGSTELVFSQSQTDDGGALGDWKTPQVVDGRSYTVTKVRKALVTDGQPAILYVNEDNNGVMYAVRDI